MIIVIIEINIPQVSEILWVSYKTMWFSGWVTFNLGTGSNGDGYGMSRVWVWCGKIQPMGYLCWTLNMWRSVNYSTLTLSQVSFLLTCLVIWSLWFQNGHHNWICIEKPLQNIYNTHLFSSFAIYGYSNHKTNIIIEFTLKNDFRTYITLTCLVVLPYMVTPITKQT